MGTLHFVQTSRSALARAASLFKNTQGFALHGFFASLTDFKFQVALTRIYGDAK